MLLKKIKIINYRSIEKVTLNIEPLNDSTCSYGLIGINEAGKSSILKSIALKDGLVDSSGKKLPAAKDFKDYETLISVEYIYELKTPELSALKKLIIDKLPDIKLNTMKLRSVVLKVDFDDTDEDSPYFKCATEGCTLDGAVLKIFNKVVTDYIVSKAHRTIFWTAEDKYLISKPINLAKFSSDPDNTSVPLKNCFSLAGIENIEKSIKAIRESTDREKLENDLGEAVTQHINEAWAKHPIKITFNISDGLINFHIHDLDSNAKAKTADQRSDGFKQFVSFLLTVSAENKSEELSNTILLLDEPETHLHPLAQEDLLEELIKLTKNARNNVVIFATHSNYMIDKKDLSRNYKVSKLKDSTKIEKFSTKMSTYASVTYEVFDITSTDYHNELYAILHEKYQIDNPKNKEACRILNFNDNYLAKNGQEKKWGYLKHKKRATLSTYIRNAIHHPDNGNKYTEVQLRQSIEFMRELL